MKNDNGVLYDSYVDFWALVNLAGFDTCEFSDIPWDDPDRAVIFCINNGNTTEACSHHKPKAKCKVILWQMEFPRYERGQLVGNECPDYVDEMWVSDQYHRSLIRNPRCKYVFLGGHPYFGGLPTEPKLWDVCHMCYLYGVREAKITWLTSFGYKVAPATYDLSVRSNILSASKWGLMLHQNNIAIKTPLRCVLFASWRLPIIADFTITPEPYQIFMEPLLHFDPNNSELSNDRLVKDVVEFNYQLVSQKFPFRKCVEEAI
ncbi:MAG: hypothetical protein GY861_20015 [bacterium]|nr:hypothetical protein [bacterium]